MTPPSPVGPAVQVRALSKAYPSPRGLLGWLRPWRPAPTVSALQGVDLQADSGELVAVLGPNGAGKTTLLKVLAGLVSASAGQVLVHGVDVVHNPQAGRTKVGYVLTEERSFFWRLSVQDNLRFFAALEGYSGPRGTERVLWVAELLALGELLKRRFSDLSAGQRQRVALARGMLADPPVLVFDEATRALDPGRAEQVRRMVRELIVEKQGRAVLFATHDLHEARAIADRVVLLSRGKVACEGRYDDVEAQITDAFRAEAQAEESALARVLGGGA